MRLLNLNLLVLATSTIASTPFPKRDLPVDHGCIPCDPNDAPFYQEAQELIAAIDQALLAEGQTSHEYTWPTGYFPQLCVAPGVNCITSEVGVRWTEVGGLSDPLGRWPKEDGTETIAWGRWQSTLQFVGSGGSGTAYDAHCTMFVCAKGRMRAEIGQPGHVPLGSVSGDGMTSNDAENICDCFPTDLDADIHFSLFDPSATQMPLSMVDHQLD